MGMRGLREVVLSPANRANAATVDGALVPPVDRLVHGIRVLSAIVAAIEKVERIVVRVVGSAVGGAVVACK